MQLSLMTEQDLYAEILEIEERSLDCWDNVGMADLRRELADVQAELSRRAAAKSIEAGEV